MSGYITVGIIVFCMLIEITPIKINPIAWLGKMLNKHTNDKLDNLEIKVDKIDIETLRNRIASTATLIKNGGKLTEDQFKVIFKDIDKWNSYHSKYPDLNGIVNVSIEIIKEAYKNK